MPFQSRASRSFITNARLWYLLDARDQINGRLASYISAILQGKTKPTYHPVSDLGDHVVVVNARHIAMMGERQWETKIYRHHTGYPGGFRELNAREVHEKDPCQILWRAVRGMLPKTRSRNMYMKRLHLFPDEEHPFARNIYAKLLPPAPMPRRLGEYSISEMQKYPKIF